MAAGIDITDLLAIKYGLLADFKLDDDAALYLLDDAGAETLAPEGSWYVEPDFESGDLTVRLFPVNGLTFAVIDATVDVAYYADADTGWIRYGPMARGQWKQASDREWKKRGAKVAPWDPPAEGGEFSMLTEAGSSLLTESASELLTEAAP